MNFSIKIRSKTKHDDVYLNTKSLDCFFSHADSHNNKHRYIYRYILGGEETSVEILSHQIGYRVKEFF